MKTGRQIRTAPDVKSPLLPGGEVVAIAPGSPAEQLGLEPGDRILSINGAPVRDVIDFQYGAADDDLAMVIERSGHSRTVRATSDQAVGVRFKDPTFDGITWCNNKCPFCFVMMNPARARPSLYLKDDDFRYSALYGNFVTLTNLEEEDWQRIERQRLSPLYVSVHATDLALRRRLLGNSSAPDILAQIDRLTAIGVRCHTQAVLCPGINDGPELDRTIDDLAARFAGPNHSDGGVISLSLVPVGLTGVGKHPAYLRRHTAEEAAAVLSRTDPYRRRFRRDLGRTFLQPSDEFYLMGGVTIPPARHYDGYEQYQNGVGMVRSLLDEWGRIRRSGRRPARKVTAVTGALIAPVLGPMLDALGVEHVTVVNSFFGAIVTVAGLLTARDIIAALEGRPLGEIVALPRSTLDVPGERFLDDLTPADVQAAIGRPLAFVETLADVLRAANGIVTDPRVLAAS